MKKSIQTPASLDSSTGEIYPTVRHPSSRVRVYTRVRGVSKTHQSHKDVTDIQSIMKRYHDTGHFPTTDRQPQYADITQIDGDLTQRLNESRAVLDAAGRKLDQAQKRSAEQRKKAQIDLEDEVKRLRELEKKVKENREE